MKRRRTYTQQIRAQSAAETRDKIVAAARQIVLRRGELTMDTVAKRAGVVRATVFKQFGSKRALLISVEEDAAERAGVMKLVDKIMNGDALEAALVDGMQVWDREREIFQRFYGEPDLADVVKEKEELRFQIAKVVAKKSGVDATTIWLLSGWSTYEKLSARGMSAKAMGALLMSLVNARRGASPRPTRFS